MYRKNITYTDFNGVERSEDFYFNLTEAEVVEWMTTNSDYTLDKVLEDLTKKRDIKSLLESVKDLIYRAYGEISLDGRRFVKNPEVKANFMETNAYSQLFLEIATDAKAAAEFFNNTLPKDLAEKVDQITKKQALNNESANGTMIAK